jgi:PAS domain S-box-containing protein
MGYKEFFQRPAGYCLGDAPPLARSAVAFVLVGVSTVIGLALRPGTYTTPYLFFYPAILVGLWLAGFGAGFTATVLSAIVVDHFFLPPYGRWAFTPMGALRSMYFVLSFGMICWLIERRQTQAKSEIKRQAEVLEVAEGHRQSLGSELHLAQERAQTFEAEWNALIESAPHGFLRADRAGRFLRVNSALVAMLGYASAEEMTADKTVLLLYRFSVRRDQFIAELDRVGAITGFEAEWVAKDGRPLYVRLGGRRVAPGEYETFVQDITQERRLEQQFRQAQKMEAVGRLAGGVAHDFNNLLMIIMGQAELLANRADLPEAARQRTAEILAAAERAGTLTSQLLAFSRKQILKLEPVDLNALVQHFSNVLARLLGEDIRTEIVLEPLLDFIRGDKGQIEQVLLNLAVNSRDAMPAGGQFIIETARVTLDEQYAKTHSGVKTGRYVMLAVSDTGIGMDQDTQARIFEPFFTTKEQGKGTGLGLSMIYGTVKQMQGNIWVYSEVGKGTTFKIYFPILEEQLEIAPEWNLAVVPARLQLTVVVVEDNTSLRALIGDYLEVEGCRVIAAADGEEALRQVAAFPGPIDLLLTDVVLPGKNGKQVARDLALLRPEIKVVYTSGYTPNAIVHHGVLDPGVHFLQKPFTRAELTAKLREATQAS